jgi:hypothetical protein
VVFILDPDGPFEISYDLSEGMANRKRFNPSLGGFEPLNTDMFIAGGDPFKFKRTSGNRKSKGGGAVWMKWDPVVDHDRKPFNEWKSARFVCVYNHRPDTPDATGDYAEDMLKMCVYFGCKMNPEINISLLWDHFVDRGYAGFLHYMMTSSGSLNSNPGWHATDAVKQKIFQNYMDYVENHIEREHHMGLLEQLRDIGGPEDFTDFDLFAAAGGARLGDEQKYRELEKYQKAEIELTDYFETYEY